MDGLVFEGVRLLGVESIVAIQHLPTHMPSPRPVSKGRVRFYKNQCGIFKFGAYRRLYFPV